jgi:hypothetical protein
MTDILLPLEPSIVGIVPCQGQACARPAAYKLRVTGITLYLCPACVEQIGSRYALLKEQSRGQGAQAGPGVDQV